MQVEKSNLDLIVDGLIKTIHKNTPTNDLGDIALPKCREAIGEYLLEVIAAITVVLGKVK